MAGVGGAGRPVGPVVASDRAGAAPSGPAGLFAGPAVWGVKLDPAVASGVMLQCSSAKSDWQGWSSVHL